MKPDPSILTEYLDEVSAHIGTRKGKKDLLLELRSAILDRAEDVEGEEPAEGALEKALAAMGEPSEIALAYSAERYLVGPRMYRPFLIYTGILFVIHVVMISVASATGMGIEVFPMSILRVARPHSLLNLLFVATQALLMDIGLMVVIFSAFTRTRSSVRLPRVVFRVQAGFRPAMTRAFFALLVMLILNLFRDHLFIVVVDKTVHPMFTGSFARCLPLLNALLVLEIARETGYAFLGERRGLVAADGLLSLLASALMIWFIRQSSFLALPLPVNEPSSDLPTMNQLLAKGVHLFLIIFAVAFAVAAVKRFVRLRQLWN